MILIDRRFFTVLALACAFLLTGGRADAQQRPAVPSEPAIEILIKQSLLSFNDANLTGNYTVFHAGLAETFRQQFTVERIRDAFRGFHDQQIDLVGILLHRPRLTKAATINANNVLELEGLFDTRPLNVVFAMQYLASSTGEWKLVGLNINVRAPAQTSTAPAPAPAPGTPPGPRQSARGSM